MFCNAAMVTMHDGALRQLKYLQEGQEVLSRCEATGALVPRRITHCFESDGWTHYVHMEGGVQLPIEVTADQQFFILNRGWVVVRDIRLGDRIRTKAGDGIAVYLIEASNDIDTVYSLAVACSQCCFVGALGLEARLHAS